MDMADLLGATKALLEGKLLLTTKALGDFGTDFFDVSKTFDSVYRSRGFGTVNVLLPGLPFFTPRKHQEILGFLLFSGGSEKEATGSSGLKS